MKFYFYSVIIHPANNECPLYSDDDANCNDCEYCTGINTLGGEFYIECDVSKKDKD